MRSIVFDTGPIINLAVNNLLWILKPMKESFNGEFYITKGVYDELVERPLHSKKFKLEAFQILHLISEGILTIYETQKIHSYAEELCSLMNKCFIAHNNYIKLVHFAEIEALSCARAVGAECVVIDERTTRKMIENIENVSETLKFKLHTNIQMDKNNIKKVKELISHYRVIRSIELFTVAYKMGLITKNISTFERNKVKNIEKEMLEGGLWALKLNGASISQKEIETIVRKFR